MNYKVNIQYNNKKMNNKIYRCNLDFEYTLYYISIILLAYDIDEAKNKF